MPREEIGDGVRVGDRCANTGPSVCQVEYAPAPRYGVLESLFTGFLPRRPLTLGFQTNRLTP